MRKRALAAVAAGVWLAQGSITPARGQQPNPPAAESSQDKAAAANVDINTRYRFRERYALEAAPGVGTGLIGQYRVAFRESATTTVERPQAAPTRRDLSIQAIYQELPIDASPLDERQITSAIRRYETFRIDPEPERPSGTPTPFEGLSLLYKDRPGDAPQILSLTKGRPLTSREYLFASRQVFLPDLTFLLPELPVRAGDPYRVSRVGCEALLGSTVYEGSLEGKLLNIRPDAKIGPGKLVATFDISGRVVIQMGPADVHAQLKFLCTPVPAATSTNRVPIMEAPGQIMRLAEAYELDTGPTRGNGPDAPPRMSMRRELVLERNTTEPGPPLPVPSPLPEPQPENSWLTYTDPQGRFSFLHPQELQPQPAEEADVIRLIHPRRGGPDVVVLEVRPRSELNFETMRDGWFEARKAEGIQTVAGAEGPLPSRDWPGMKVSRFEAAMLPAAAGGTNTGRVHFDGYVLQTGRDLGFYAEATTVQDPPAGFRAEVEAMLRGIKLEGATK